MASGLGWWLAHVPPDHVAYWDFDDPAIPDAPRDTSATAIAAAALLKLGRRDEATAAVDALTRRLGPTGGLVDGCYNRKKNLAVGHELIWGDYFLLETSTGLRHHLDTTSLKEKDRSKPSAEAGDAASRTATRLRSRRWTRVNAESWKRI